MNMVNIDRESFHLPRTTRGTSMKFSGKMWLIIMLNVTKFQGFTLSLQENFWKNCRGWRSNWPAHPPPPPQLFKGQKQLNGIINNVKLSFLFYHLKKKMIKEVTNDFIFQP